MRLQKFLAECGVASRRASENHVAAGRVAVNGVTAQVGDSVNPDEDEVTLDGRRVLPDEKVYIVLHKPRGVVTSVGDTHHRKTVLDCVTGVSARIFPVGRLDLDVSGTLLLTNDGELAFRLTHPKYRVGKTYMVKVRGTVSPESAARLRSGIELEDGLTAPASLSVLKTDTQSSLLRLEIHEGRKRLVKRMCAAVGHPVLDLRRLSVASVTADDLVPGEWRHLHEGELAELRRLTGLQA